MRQLGFGLSVFVCVVLVVFPAFGQYDDENDPPPGGETAKGGVTHDVTVFSSFFQPSNVFIKAGDTVRWTYGGGLPHNVIADDLAFTSGDIDPNPWEYSFTFTEADVGANPYYCTQHGSPGGFGMSGNVSVAGAGDDDDDDDDGFLVNFGIGGSWANLLTLGQGWLFEVIPGFDPPVMVAYNFTYPPLLVQKGGEPEFFGNQMWLVGAAEIVGNQVTVMADRPFGGAFDSAAPAPIIDDEPYATFIFTFFDCFNALVEYDIPSKALTGEYEIERITPDVMCEDLAAQP